MREPNAHPAYRADIDGLRAMAILAVVVFHAFPTAMPGGFIGVDVFFVMSGYLISSILFRSLAEGHFDFGDFYAHRVRRIFPALVLVLATAFAAGWLTLLPDEFKQLGKHMAAGAGFVQNLVLLQEAGYFDTASELKPLMHLWSLAIEEQFYLLYPLLVWAAWRLKLSTLVTIGVLGALSFGLNIVGVQRDAVATFFAPQTRFWELLAGAALANLHVFSGSPPASAAGATGSAPQPGAGRHLISIIGLSLIAAAAFGLRKDQLFPGWRALAPVVGASLLIAAGPSAWINRHLLARRPLVFVGLISYPLYLWHWPILVFARIVESRLPTPNVRLAALALSVVLAWLTYRWVERPIRFGARKGRTTMALCFAMLAVAGTGLAAVGQDGLPFRTMAKAKRSISRNLSWDGLFDDPACTAKYGMSPCMGAAEHPDVIVLGDSHANHLYPGLAALDGHVTVAPGTCPPLEGVTLRVLKNQANHACAGTDFLAKNLATVQKTDSLRTAVLSAFWRPLLNGRIANAHERDYWGGTRLTSRYPDEQGLSQPELIYNGLDRTIGQLETRGLAVLLVRDTVDIPEELPEYCQLKSLFMPLDCTVPRASFARGREPEDALMARLQKAHPRLIVIDPIDRFCDKDRCFLMRNGVLYYRDQHHLSVAGSALLAGAIQGHLR